MLMLSNFNLYAASWKNLVGLIGQVDFLLFLFDNYDFVLESLHVQEWTVLCLGLI